MYKYNINQINIIQNNLLRKNRNRLNITKRGDLRLLLTGFTPNIKKNYGEASTTTITLIF